MSVFKPGLFKNKVCLVTGGGTGIGKAIATELVALGGKVIIAARNMERLEKAADQLNTVAKRVGSPAVSCQQLNIRDEQAVGNTVAQLIERHGRIDCLVNNGGGQFASPALAIRPKGFRAVVDTNLNGTFFMCQSLYLNTAPLKRPGMSIVNITADTRNGFPGMVHTGAARAAVNNMTLTLSREWGSEGIRINTVAPGIVLSSGINNYPDEFRPQFFVSGDSVPIGRPGSESEIASAVVFLLSPAAAYITGTVVPVDGGGSLQKEDFASRRMLTEARDMDGTDPAERAAAVAAGTAPFHVTEELRREFDERNQLRPAPAAAGEGKDGDDGAASPPGPKSKL